MPDFCFARSFRLVACLGTIILVSLAILPGPADATRLFGQVFRPSSGVENPSDIGFRVHTHVRVFSPAVGMDRIFPPANAVLRQSVQTNTAPPYSQYFYIETPASLACIYDLSQIVIPGCNPYTVTSDATGGAHAIALVDAYDDPTAAADLSAFSSQFGLPGATFQVVYAGGSRPSYSSGWALEESLDIEWAHAMAPKAMIYLVEASSSNLSSLMTAVTDAGNLVSAAGGGEVSMSWGSSEFSGETAYDGFFTKSGVVYVASAGDSAGVEYPSASPNVVAVGGTTISRNPNTGNFQQELSWQQTGGGPSAYESRPSYQTNIASMTGSVRGVPDVAAIADPTTGVWVYQDGSWSIVGGTSVAAPVWAGIINAAGKFSRSSVIELAMIYGSPSGYSPVANGDCGPYEGYLAMNPWSFCTGHGSPKGVVDK